jgi:hypothetical protein
MILNCAPLSWSCWYSSPVKDGVLRKCGFQALCAKVCVSGVSLTVLRPQFINTGSLKFVFSLLKQVSSEDLGSKS